MQRKTGRPRQHRVKEKRHMCHTAGQIYYNSKKETIGGIGGAVTEKRVLY